MYNYIHKILKIKKSHLHKHSCLLVILLVCFISCNGQTQSVSPTDSVSELPAHSKIMKPTGAHKDDNIRCGLQDKAGNLWFGTSGEGVYRYDGKSFTNFTTKDGLGNNIVWSILEDKTGKIWLGTDNGLCQYDGKNFTPVPIVVTSGSNSFNPSGKNAVLSMLQDKSGKIWLGTENGLYCYDGKGFTLFLDNKAILNDSSLHLKGVNYIVEAKNGNMWFASGMRGREGICRYDGQSVTNFKPGGDVWIRTMMEDKNGNMWFGTRSNGMWRYDGKTYSNFTEKQGLGLSISSVTSIAEDKAGNIWFGVETRMAGVWCYDGRSFKTFTTKDGLVNNSIWYIIEDRDGNIWVGSRNNGLSRYDGKSFTPFTE